MNTIIKIGIVVLVLVVLIIMYDMHNQINKLKEHSVTSSTSSVLLEKQVEDLTNKLKNIVNGTTYLENTKVSGMLTTDSLRVLSTSIPSNTSYK